MNRKKQWYKRIPWWGWVLIAIGLVVIAYLKINLFNML